jgi:Flp pilus assembly protein TadD
MRASLDGAPPLSALRVAAESRPADGRAWYLLAGATKDQTEREAALRRATALWPDGALAHAALASHLATTGRAGEALPLANQAVDLAPWNPDVVAALALTALALGKCQEALELQARAVDVAKAGGLGAAASDAKALGEQLAKYRTRCSQSQAATALTGFAIASPLR